MNVGLLFVAASVYQMEHSQPSFLAGNTLPTDGSQLCTVFVGVSLVGASSIFNNTSNPELSLLQKISPPHHFNHSQNQQTPKQFSFVIEEKVLSKYKVNALKAVGLEGVFGLLTGFNSLASRWKEVFYVQSVFYIGIGICFSISLFNWSGLSVTQTVSATSRSTIDTCRTVFIWAISMGLGWETFKWLQVAGFVVLIYGTFVFNDVVVLPSWLGMGRAEDSEVVVDDDEL
ncbi:hypothetical protein BDR26DRAFT_934206 [Obelidium mucronatum]|nr:hypothetical protein BDR26DRAFT_934206 [Obelidium mucronatum]